MDALEHNWKAPDWDAYVEVNRARVEQREPAMTVDRLRVHHHAMLRSLVLPYRKNVPEQATAIINAAADVLPPDDSLLQSAIRRHRAASQAQASPSAEEMVSTAPDSDATSVAPLASDVPEAIAPEAPTQAPGDGAGNPQAGEGEFDKAWTK